MYSNIKYTALRLILFFVLTLIFSFVSLTEAFAEGEVELIYSNTNYSGSVNNLTSYEGKLYGTKLDESTNEGVVFVINADGTGYVELHTFHNGDTANGAWPNAQITINNGVIYGTTNGGGQYSGNGIAYSINTDGSGFTILHSFGNGADGTGPLGGVLFDNGKLYGITASGGTNNRGNIYSLDINGSNYTSLYSFATSQGFSSGTPILYGGKLYGMDQNSAGAVFSIDIDGTDYTELHQFGVGIDGSYPYEDLTYYNGKIYGMTQSGGSVNCGILFSIDPEGLNYTVLHEFDCNNDGGYPYGSLVEYGGKLYAAVTSGGVNNKGTIISINPDGTGFTVLHTFAGTPTDGYAPQSTAAPAILDGKLYTFTVAGGASNNGAIIAYTLPDLTPPVIQSVSPISGSTITDQTPLVTLILDEVGSCRASFIDESYDDMSTDIDCAGDNSTNISCQIPSLGANGVKQIYFACTDVAGNKDTADSNTYLTYTLNVPASEEKVVEEEKEEIKNSGGSTTYIPVTTSDDNVEDSNEVEDETENSLLFYVLDQNGNFIAGAKVVIDGVEYISDVNGAIKLSSALPSDANVTVTINQITYVGTVRGANFVVQTAEKGSEVRKNEKKDSNPSKVIDLKWYYWVLPIILLPVIVYIKYLSKRKFQKLKGE